MKQALLSRSSLSALLTAALATLALHGCHPQAKRKDAITQPGTVVRLVAPSTGLGLQICDPQGAACWQAGVGSAVPAGSVLRSGPRTTAQVSLADGTGVALDHDTELHLASGSRRGRLSRGSIVVDTVNSVQLDVNDGSVTLGVGKMALRAGADFAILDVVRGSARLGASSGNPLPITAGEEARLYRGSAPYVSSGAVLADAVAFTDNLLDAKTSGALSRGLGELTARKPGSQDERRGAVTLASHSVRVRIAGAMARTEVDEVFENSSDDVLEGIYRFPIPTDAKIERLALEVDGKLEEGAFVDRDRAASIWRGAIVNAAPQMRPQIKDDIVWVPGPWRDPALLEWQRGGRFELKIFPIPKRGQRRIVLAYTEAVRPVGGVRHFTYPLPVDPGGTTKIRHFDVDVEVRGQDPTFAVRTSGYPLAASDRDGVRALQFRADDFTPNGDLSLEWALPNRQSELTAFGYRAGDERYALLTLRPQLPRATSGGAHAVVIVVDTSRSMFGEGLDRAKGLATRLARELDPSDQFTILACDSTCRELSPGFFTPGQVAFAQAERFLGSIPAEGASDPTLAIASANRALEGAPKSLLKDIVYIGDGTPTVGPIRSATVTAAVRESLAESLARVTAVAVGSSSDLDTLGALARAGGGLVLPYAPGQTVGQATLGVLAATYGSALRDVEVVLPDGLRNAAPARLDTILAGSEASLSARMDSDDVHGSLIVRGKVGDAPFEQRYEVHVAASDNAGNAFVPRIYAAARIGDLEQNGDAEAKKEALALSARFAVASRYSSLLVLESEAMFRAFGLDTADRGARFTGQELAEQSEAKGEIALEDGEIALDASSSSDGARAEDKKSAGGALGGLGTLAPMGAAEAAAPNKAKAPAPSSVARRASRDMAGPGDDRFADPPPAPVVAAPAAASPQRIARPDFEEPEFVEPRRRMIPMRRVWDRKGRLTAGDRAPRPYQITALADAERALSAEPDRKLSLKKSYILNATTDHLGRAASLVERWVEKEPLDPEALTARADLAARRGDRELAVRMLGSVVDVRPDDVASQKRLARLYRWSGRPELGCRHAIAIAELRAGDPKLLADALRCARTGLASRWASDALSLVDEKTARAAATLAEAPATDDSRLAGDLRVEASWDEDADLDLGILHPDGQRVSWLGAPTREVIAARDVLDHGKEGLSLNGAKPGEYVVEVVRAGGSSGPVHGTLTVTASGETRRFPFLLRGEQLTVAFAEITMVPRLVPLTGMPAIAGNRLDF